MNRLSFLALSTTLALALTLTGAGLTGQAAPPTPESPPPRPRYEGLEEIPFFDTNLSQPGSRASAAPLDLASWSKIVFESYRDDNWEIYLANGDGSSQARLTYDAAVDMHPRLNRGCTRTAFASNRTGNYEIFTMNLNGSGLMRLTSNNTDDAHPAWSPAGTKIAFQAYRDGQAEIYVMNANGSGQTRLTQSSTYDGEPAWSPDGAQIAFDSDRTGGYGIWIMNADGSGQTQLASQPYSEHPAWSPDSTQIAYDADGNSDGWQELWVMNADGSDQRQVYDPPEYQTDAWAGSWSPDGRYVIFARIAWVYYNGDWYWTSAYLEAWDSVSGNFVSLSNQDTDWYPDWQTTDARAPASQIDPLPAYFRGDLTVTWGGSDGAGSGIKTYDVQYRDTATGGWTDWQMGTADTSAGFSGTAGHTYYFRSRAMDNAYNLESWPLGDGDTYTTFYTWVVSGTVRANRDTPVAGATITTTPEALTMTPSNSEGVYVAYVADSASTYGVAWDKRGYSSLPVTEFEALEDVRADVILPPADNAVRNWGFESGNLAPGDWRASGVITPVVTNTLRHTGHYAALLGGQKSWFSPGLNLSNNYGDSWLPQVATDSNGAVHVVWHDFTPSQFGLADILYARRGSDGSWSDPKNISNSPDESSYMPLLVVDGPGNVHVVWKGYASIYYARRGSDGTWSSPQELSSATGGFDWQHLVADGGGTVHLVWQDNSEIFYARRPSDGPWSSPQNISNNSGNSTGSRLAVDGSGIVHVVWQDDTPGNYDIFYARRSGGGTWSSPQNISNTPEESDSPQLVADASGTVHVVWSDGMSDYADIYYVRRGSGGAWSSPENISTDPEDSHGQRLALDGSGNVHVVWGGVYYARRDSSGLWSGVQSIASSIVGSGSPQIVVEEGGVVHVVWCSIASRYYGIYYAQRGTNGSWSSPQKISGGNFPMLAVEESGAINVVWQETPPWESSTEVLYARSVFAEQAGDSGIAQSVTAPITVPTLSYQLGGASSTSGNWFNVRVDRGVTATVLFSQTVNTSNWTHYWFDLSPWAGQAITLTFNMHQTAGQPYAWAYLDEVSLGSAYSDLWVSKSGQPQVKPGARTTYTITYGNRGGVAASSVRITDTLPAGLSFVAASPPPTTTTPSLVWKGGDLPARSGSFTIVVTAAVPSRVVGIRSVTNTVSTGAILPELETANNLAYVVTFIGHRIYLPLVMKGYFD